MAMERVNTAEGGCATRIFKAAALFHPRVSRSSLKAFKPSLADFTILDRLEPGGAFDAALVFGGDGSIHRHLRSIIELKIPLLVVPAGSGNDFAHALGIHSSNDAVKAWQQFCAGGQNVRNIDAGVIRWHPEQSGLPKLETGDPKPETYFCNIAGVGLDCDANRRANAMPRWLRKHGGYIVAALGAILGFRPIVVTIFSGQTKISQPAVLVAVANSASYGSGMRIAPRAKLSDGLLDVCFIRRIGRLRLLRYFPRVFRGEHVSLPEVGYSQTAQLRIESEQPLDLYADGERICQTPLEISVLPGRLKVIVPS